MKKKIALLLACVMAFGIAVGSTLAWLTDTTGEVTNTFTDSDINITLTESENLNLQMIPGHTITKDPKVTVKADSEACWLFVEVTEANDFDDYMQYAVVSTGDKAWTQGDGTDIPANVYYQKIAAKTATDTDYPVLTGNTVTVNGTVTKAMMDAIDGVVAADAAEGAADAEIAARPTLTFKAYASQLYTGSNPAEFTAAEAWNNVKPAT